MLTIVPNYKWKSRAKRESPGNNDFFKKKISRVKYKKKNQ